MGGLFFGQNALREGSGPGPTPSGDRPWNLSFSNTCYYTTGNTLGTIHFQTNQLLNDNIGLRVVVGLKSGSGSSTVVPCGVSELEGGSPVGCRVTITNSRSANTMSVIIIWGNYTYDLGTIPKGGFSKFAIYVNTGTPAYNPVGGGSSGYHHSSGGHHQYYNYHDYYNNRFAVYGIDSNGNQNALHDSTYGYYSGTYGSHRLWLLKENQANYPGSADSVTQYETLYQISIFQNNRLVADYIPSDYYSGGSGGHHGSNNYYHMLYRVTNYYIGSSGSGSGLKTNTD